jgi:hemoglobin-like flavoprotein
MGVVCSSQPEITMDLQVRHFTPSSFPLVPSFNKTTTKICKKSWETLMKMTFKSSQTGLDTASITVFYNEFYQKLYLFDTSHRFEAILSKHVGPSSGGRSNIAAKGAIIVRIVKFSLALENNEQGIMSLKKLGNAHRLMGISGWQYSIFVEVLLNTIARQLGVHATYDVMACWVNLFAFIFQYMLPNALVGLVTGSDLNVATHTTHVDRDNQAAAELEANVAICTSHSKNSRLNSLKEDVLGEMPEPEPDVGRLRSSSSPSRRNSSDAKGGLRKGQSSKFTSLLDSEIDGTTSSSRGLGFTVPKNISLPRVLPENLLQSQGGGESKVSGQARGPVVELH